MAANSTDTYDMVGIREDLINVIYNVDPTDTPFLSMAPKVKVSNTLHEWQTDTLAAAADDKQVEGADATFAAASPTVRLNNRTQITRKTSQISGTTEETNRAGRGKEMAYQLVKDGLEMKRNMETTLVGTNKAKVTGNKTTARECASMQSWLATNTSRGTGGSDPTGDGTDAATDGTQRVFTEALLESVIDSIWESGGKPDVIMTGSFNKRKLNGFTGRADTSDHRVEKGSIIAAADLYKSDYGDLKMIPNRFSRARDALVYQKDKFAVGYLGKRNFQTTDIAKTGDADKKMIITEFTLVARNEKSSGVVADLTTS